MIKKYLLFCFLFLAVLIFMSYSEEKLLQLVIQPEFTSERVVQNKWFVTENKDSIQFSKLKFYLTNFEIEQKDGTTFPIPNSNFLVDAFTEESLHLKLPEVEYAAGDKLLFNIGVEEAMNTSGALAGALDPVNGMFWSWQSGYINFKLEGKSPSCATRNNKFQFHIGGYKEPFKTTKRVALQLNEANEIVLIPLKLDRFFTNIHLEKENQIMIPGEAATTIAEILPTLFSINE